MNSLTRFGFHWVAPLVAAGLLAGCQGSRPAFQFAPAAPYVSARQPVAAPATFPPTATGVVSAAGSPQLAALPAPWRRAVGRLASRPARADARGLTQAPGPVAPGPAVAAVAALATSAEVAEVATAPRQHRAHRVPARAQESGLGRIALFFLAVLLGVLAGLGALLSLIPGVSFFGGVGLAAAGLLVLFLLYSLLSGGSKKKK